jgi:hypothetical protein
MKAFLKTQIQVVIQSILITFILYFIHHTVFFNVLPNVLLIVALFKIYLFHFLVTTVIILIISYKQFQGYLSVFNLFIFFTMLKMLLVVVFLLPVFLSDMKNRNYDVFNFFIPYFIYLTFEVYSISKLLQKQK